MANVKKTTLVFFFILIGINITAERYYVKPNGNDEDLGTSWNTAFATLLKAAKTTQIGDEVWAACGTYREEGQIVIPEQAKFYGGFMGNETDLSQRDAATSITVVDGNKTHRCFSTKKDSLLDGFHITGGTERYGGGVFNSGTVSNCFIYKNETIDSGFGGGLYNNYGTVTSCTLFLNSCDNRGGGLANTGGTVTSCTFYENTSNNGAGFTNYDGTASECIVYQNEAQYYGGGIVNQTGGILNRCKVFQNKANVGAGIANELGAEAISHCTIFQNKGLQGGGVHLAGGVISNCAIFLNKAGAGGGIHMDGGEVLNTTLFQNEGIYGGGIDFDGGRAKCTIIKQNLDNDIRLTSGILEYCCFGGAPATDGNIDADPLFEKPWDFHLQETSPCIDAGNPDASWNDACLPPGKETARNDMGAYGGPNNCTEISIYIPKEKDYIDYLLFKTEFKPFDLNGDQKIDISDMIVLLILK